MDRREKISLVGRLYMMKMAMEQKMKNRSPKQQAFIDLIGEAAYEIEELYKENQVLTEQLCKSYGIEG